MFLEGLFAHYSFTETLNNIQVSDPKLPSQKFFLSKIESPDPIVSPYST